MSECPWLLYVSLRSELGAEPPPPEANKTNKHSRRCKYEWQCRFLCEEGKIMKAILCMPETEPLDIIPWQITVHYLHLQYLNVIQGGNIFCEFLFHVSHPPRLPAWKEWKVCRLLPMPVQHIGKIMFSKATNKTAVKASFLLSWSTAWEVLFISTWTLEVHSSHCFLEQPPSLLPVPCGLYSAVHDQRLLFVNFSYSVIQKYKMCIYVFFFFITSWKILYISEGFVIHSFWIKDLYLPHNRSGVMKCFIKPLNIY